MRPGARGEDETVMYDYDRTCTLKNESGETLAEIDYMYMNYDGDDIVCELPEELTQPYATG